jgi:Tfp pilus assembly protein PilE
MEFPTRFTKRAKGNSIMEWMIIVIIMTILATSTVSYLM